MNPGMLPSRRREHLFALLAFTLFATALLWEPLLAPPERIIGGADISIKYPFKAYWVASLKEGRPAFWNPYTAMGIPLAAHPNLAAFSPFNILHFLMPHSKAFTLQDLLHFILAAMGAYAFARRLGAGLEGALLAGMAYGFSGFNIVHLFSGQPNLWWNAAWSPWVLAALHRALDRKDPAALAGASAFLAFGFFEGYPQVTYYTLMACALLLLTAWIGRTCSFRTMVLSGATLVILFGALSACQLIPSSVFVRHTSRMAWGYGQIMCDYLSPQGLRHLVQPDFLGNPLTNDWKGRWGYHELVQYIGWIPLGLFLVGLPFARRLRNYPLLALIALLFAVLSLGDSTVLSRTVFGFLYDYLPGFSSHRSIARMMVMTGLGASVGAALVLSSILPGEGCRSGRRTAWLIVARILLAVTALDLWLFGARFISTVPTALYDDVHQLFPSPMVEEVLADPGHPRINPSNKINANLFFRVAQIDTNDRTVLRGAEAFVVAMSDRPDSPMADIASVKYLYATPGRLKNPHFREGPPGHYVNQRAYPRAFLVGGWERVTDFVFTSMRAMQSGAVVPRSVVYLDDELSGLPSQPGIAGEARIVRYEDNRLEVECRAERPGLLVLTDNHYPQWTARVDGKSEAILPAFGVFRAVPIRSAGEHRVVFEYRPWDLFLGLAVSIPAWFFLAIFLLGIRKAREEGHEGAWRRLARLIVGNRPADSVIMTVNFPRSDDMAKKNRRKKKTVDAPMPLPAAVPATAPATEEPPKAAVLAVRLVLLLLIGYVVYQVFLKPAQSKPAGQAPSPASSMAAPGTRESAPALQVAPFSRPITIDGIVMRRGYQGWGDGPMLDKSVRGMTLTVADKTYEKGIGTHAPAELQFDLNGKARRFSALLGADADGGTGNQVVFIVQLDGKKAFESPVLVPGSAPVKLDLDVSDARRMSIIVKGDGSWDHADILNPRFTLASAEDASRDPKKK